MKGRGGNNNSGFTLVELLLAISIFSIVISLVYGTYRVTFITINHTEYHAQVSAKACVILKQMTEDLESFYAGTNSYFVGEEKHSNGHRADSLSWTSTAHLVFKRKEKPARLTRLKYYTEVENDSGLLSLYRLDTPVKPCENDCESEQKGLLVAQGLQEFRITYVDTEGTEHDEYHYEQVADSEGEESIPLLVRLVVRFAESSESEQTIIYRTAVALKL